MDKDRALVAEWATATDMAEADKDGGLGRGQGRVRGRGRGLDLGVNSKNTSWLQTQLRDLQAAIEKLTEKIK